MTLTGEESWHFLPKTRLQRETPKELNLYRANGRGGFGSQTAADLLW